MIRQYLTCGYGHLFTSLGVAASPVLLAIHLEIAKPGELQFPFCHQKPLYHFEDQFLNLLTFFLAESQMFRNPLGNIRFSHDPLPVAEMALKIALSL